jgi:hypothetical protein
VLRECAQGANDHVKIWNEERWMSMWVFELENLAEDERVVESVDGL